MAARERICFMIESKFQEHLDIKEPHYLYLTAKVMNEVPGFPRPAPYGWTKDVNQAIQLSTEESGRHLVDFLSIGHSVSIEEHVFLEFDRKKPDPKRIHCVLNTPD